MPGGGPTVGLAVQVVRVEGHASPGKVYEGKRVTMKSVKKCC